MGLKAAPAHTKKSDLPIIPAGLQHAIVYGVFHIGHQASLIKDVEPKDRFYISFELPYERMEYEDDTGTMRNLPRATSTEYTRSMHPKSAFRKVIEGWEGRQFTEQECDDFDITSLIGRNCQVNLGHKMGSGKHIGKTFTNIMGIFPLGRNVPERKQENPPVFFSLTDCKEGEEVQFPKGMPDFMRKKAMDSPEYAHLFKCWQDAKATAMAKATGGTPPPTTPTPTPTPTPAPAHATPPTGVPPQSSSAMPGDPF